MTSDDPSWLDVAGYYLDIGIAVSCGAIAGMALVTDAPIVAGDPLLRAIAAVLFALLSVMGCVMARDSWLRMHGLSAIAIKFDLVEEVSGSDE